jgi:hypothetical protein
MKSGGIETHPAGDDSRDEELGVRQYIKADVRNGGRA